MQRKGKIKYNIRDKLHSIPIISVKSNVLYSIPGVCMLVLCLGLFFSYDCYASTVAPQGIAEDASTVSPITGADIIMPPSVSLSLSTPQMISDTVSPGDIATVGTDVAVDVKNVTGYSLILSVDKATMTSGDTTISAGNVVNDNTWGYKWDGATSFTAPSTTGQTLTVPALINNGITFTKNLTFGVKFSDSAEAGHYKASGTLSLVATPETAAKLTLADLTEMQQLSLAPEACENTPYLDGLNYSAEYTLTDVRDNYAYTVRKLGDGKCWMTQNLRLSNQVRVGDTFNYFGAGRKLIPSTTDISTEYTLPASDVSKFNTSDTTEAVYLGADAKDVATGYYTWCAATAGTCSSATSQGAHATSSICPKGWRLPGGYNDTAYGNEFRPLFLSMGLTISNSSLADSHNGATNWGTGDLSKVQSSPYNFNYTGNVNNGSYLVPASDQYGRWWSSTVNSNTYAYAMSVDSGYVYPGTNNLSRCRGFAVRCVAS